MDISPELVTRAVEDIAMERFRQRASEGWTSAHDDEHTRGEIAAAAACYAMPSLPDDEFPCLDSGQPYAWPWSSDWWKPKDRRRDLVRAAALILAEIERLDRLPPNGNSKA